MDFECVVKVEKVLHLVVGDTAVDHRLLARVHDDERELDGGVHGRGAVRLFSLLVALNQVFEGNLLGKKKIINPSVSNQLRERG